MLPQPWYCTVAFVSQQLRYARRCAVQPLLTLRYQVRGLAQDGTTAPGRQVIDLAVGHLELAGAARITSAAARASYDAGHTWHAATVTASGRGRFRVAFTAPAGADVTLRVSARDHAGSSVTETILRGYQVRQ